MPKARRPIFNGEELQVLREAYRRAVEARSKMGAMSPEAERHIINTLVDLAKEGCHDVEALVARCRLVS